MRPRSMPQIVAFKVALWARGLSVRQSVGDPRGHRRSRDLPGHAQPAGRSRCARQVRQDRADRTASPLFTADHLATDRALPSPARTYDAALLDDFRRALIATGLVSTVTITPGRHRRSRRGRYRRPDRSRPAAHDCGRAGLRHGRRRARRRSWHAPQSDQARRRGHLPRRAGHARTIARRGALRHEQLPGARSHPDRADRRLAYQSRRL
jgi:hypothetical protein